MGKASRRKKDQAWKAFEGLVALLEKSIAPWAKIERDVKLPNLTTGHPEQFDATIRTGPPVRESLSVVEVQLRGEKVKPNDFRGWCLKRDGVGAGTLICVTEAGFPSSVVDLAKAQGNRVRLLTLADLQERAWPLDIQGKSMTLVEVAHELVGLHVIPKGPPLPTRSQEVPNVERVFRQGNELIRITAPELARRVVGTRKDFQFLPAGPHEVTIQHFPHVDQPLYCLWEGKDVELKAVKLDLNLRISPRLVPLKCSAYQQVNYEGAVAYSFSGSTNFNGKDVTMQFVVVPEDGGMFRLGKSQVDGIPPGNMTLSFFTDKPPNWPTS